MKLRSLLLVFVFVSVGFAKPPDIGKVPPLDYEPPKPDRVDLSNGVIVYLIEDHELPLFHMTMMMKMTPRDVKEEVQDAVDIMSEVWRTGGTKKRSPDELNEELELMPATVETSAGEERATISLSCLSKDIDQGLEIYADVLQNPAFHKDQIALIKSEILENLRRKNDTPISISRRVVRDVLYGANHYYARNYLPESIKRVKRKHLIELHEKVVVPNYAILAISGDFSTPELVKKLETIFKDWKPTRRKIKNYDYSVTAAPEGKIFYVEKDFNQTRLYFMNLGITRHSPEEYALAVGNYILGGGGPSRLFAEIRSRLGLAYIVGSFYSKPKGPGQVGVGCQTKAESTIKTIKAIEKEMDRYITEEPSKEELAMAKDSILNAFVFRFESLSNIVSEQAALEFYGYPKTYLEDYPKRIRRIKGADILKVAKKYFDKDKRKIILVGDKNKFDEPLESLGDVITIPLEDID